MRSHTNHRAPFLTVALAAASLSAPGVASLRRVAEPNPLVPAAAVGATTMSITALDDGGGGSRPGM